jgi:hypothetical protein
MRCHPLRWVVEAAVALLAVSGCKRNETGPTQDPGANASAVDRDDEASSTQTPLRAAVDQRKAALRGCYETTLRTQPELTGKMTYTIDVSPAGVVTRVYIEGDTTGDEELRACASATIAQWRFPASQASATVTFHVVYTTDEPTP